MIVSPIPGEDQRNSGHCHEEGTAIRWNKLRPLAWEIDTLPSDDSRFARMQQTVTRLAGPHAASGIVSIVMENSRPA